MNAAASASPPTVHIHVSGSTISEVINAALGLAGGNALAAIGTDDLLAELRERFAKQTPVMVVRVEPFEGASSGTVQGADEAKDAGKPKRPTAAEKAAAKAATDAALKEAADKAAASKAAKEADKPTNDGAQAAGNDTGGDDWDGDDKEDAAAPTVDDVKAALNACSAKVGQAATREIMKTVGGSMRLLDIGADKFADLIKALNEAEAAKAAA